VLGLRASFVVTATFVGAEIDLAARGGVIPLFPRGAIYSPILWYEKYRTSVEVQGYPGRLDVGWKESAGPFRLVVAWGGDQRGIEDKIKLWGSLLGLPHSPSLLDARDVLPSPGVL